MPPVSPDRWLLIGRVLRPHGAGGLLRIWSYASSGHSFLEAGTVFLRTEQGEVDKFKILSVKPHKNVFLMKLEGLDSLNESERYRGALIFVEKGSVSRQEDELFWYELKGLDVYLENGEFLGSIEQIIYTGANDVYQVRRGEKEFLIPAIDEVVRKIDLEKGKMIISVLEGLLELNDI